MVGIAQAPYGGRNTLAGIGASQSPDIPTQTESNRILSVVIPLRALVLLKGSCHPRRRARAATASRNTLAGIGASQSESSRENTANSGAVVVIPSRALVLLKATAVRVRAYSLIMRRNTLAGIGASQSTRVSALELIKDPGSRNTLAGIGASQSAGTGTATPPAR